MAFIQTTLKTVARAAVVAAVLGASSLVAAPAFAQSASSGFTLEIHGQNVGQRFGGGQRGDWHNGRDDGYRMRCLTNREVIRSVRAYGYDRVEIVRELRRDKLEVQAVKGNWLYSMRVDTCTGEVDRMQRIGRAFGGGNRRGDFHDGGSDDGGFNGGGFQFGFSFGN